MAAMWKKFSFFEVWECLFFILYVFLQKKCASLFNRGITIDGKHCLKYVNFHSVSQCSKYVNIHIWSDTGPTVFKICKYSYLIRHRAYSVQNM